MPTSKKRKSKNNRVQIHISELRRDFVSGDWIAIATGRARRPTFFASRKKFLHDPVEKCPFEDLKKSGHKHPLLVYQKKRGDWSVMVIENKYPAFTKGELGCPLTTNHGPYSVMEGRGFHEVVVLRDHYKSPGELGVDAVAELIHAYRERYRILAKKGCANYIAIFHNHGPESGASLTHPHSQIIAIPVIPPDVHRSLTGSQRYYEGHRRCVHCVMIEFEKREKKRIVYENESFFAFTPYVSRTAYELRIFPKTHEPHFEDIQDGSQAHLAQALQACLKKLFLGFNNPSYNYFIHTAPVSGHEHDHYHWHIEIIPKTQIWAGFEIGTGIEISTTTPEDAAKFLRSIS